MSILAVTRKDSVVDGLDPRIRLIWMLAISTIVLRYREVPPVLVVIASQVLVWILARRVVSMLRASVGIGAFMLFVAVLQFLAGLLTESWQIALYRASLEALRYFVMASAAVVLFQTTDATEIGAALRKFKHRRAPNMWNTLAEGFAFAVSFAYQLIPLIAREISGIAEVQRARGVGVREGTRMQQVRKLLSMTGPLFTRTLDLVRTGSLAMLNYGYSPLTPRTNYLELRYRLRDWIALVGIVAAVAAVYWV